MREIERIGKNVVYLREKYKSEETEISDEAAQEALIFDGMLNEYRDEIKFASLDELREQIKKDIKFAREYDFT